MPTTARGVTGMVKIYSGLIEASQRHFPGPYHYGPMSEVRSFITIAARKISNRMFFGPPVRHNAETEGQGSRPRLSQLLAKLAVSGGAWTLRHVTRCRP